MAETAFNDNVRITGNLTVHGQRLPAIARSELAQDNATLHEVPITAWRVWDAQHTNLPSAGAADDLGHVGGTFATDAPSLQTADVKAAGAVTRYARCQVQIPAEYQAGQPVTLRVRAGMKTTVADGSATLDIEAYKSTKEATVSGVDLCATAPQSINSLTFANKDFTITPTSLVAGDLLDIRLAIATNDAATVTAVIGVAGGVDLLCSIKG